MFGSSDSRFEMGIRMIFFYNGFLVSGIKIPIFILEKIRIPLSWESTFIAEKSKTKIKFFFSPTII